MTIANLRKTIAAVVGAVIAWLTVIIVSESTGISSAEWLQLVIGLATAFGVYQVPNAPVLPPRDETGKFKSAG